MLIVLIAIGARQVAAPGGNHVHQNRMIRRQETLENKLDYPESEFPGMALAL